MRSTFTGEDEQVNQETILSKNAYLIDPKIQATIERYAPHQAQENDLEVDHQVTMDRRINRDPLLSTDSQEDIQNFQNLKQFTIN